MVSIKLDLNTGESYRVFAGKGNTLSEDGVSVVLGMLESGTYVTYEFWTRQDAVKFFRHAANAAETCPVQEAGATGTMMVEDVATSWEEVSRDD